MNIIEISALKNGAHRNQNGNFENIPFGWAVVPDDMETPNFPFGEIEVEEIDGVLTVIKWVDGIVPEVVETPEEVTEFEQLRADIDYLALMSGVNL